MRANVRSERGSWSLMIGTGLVAGVIGATGIVVMAKQQADHTQQAVGAIDQAQDVQAQANLRRALTGAQVFYSENGTFVGYTPEIAAGFDPNVAYNTSLVAAPDQVSIRGATPTSIVMVTETPSGGVLCLGLDGDLNAMGRADATTVAACTGGW